MARTKFLCNLKKQNLDDTINYNVSKTKKKNNIMKSIILEQNEVYFLIYPDAKISKIEVHN
jgi:hypothetical protein